MARSYDSKKSRSEIKEARQNIESKKGELNKLEEQKQELLNALTEVQGAQLDEKVKQQVQAAINSSLEANRSKGKELSGEIGKNLKDLENVRQETSESQSSAEDQKKSVERKQKMLDRFGIGGSLESAVGELNNNIQELKEINEDAINAMREAEQLSQKLGHL